MTVYNCIGNNKQRIVTADDKKGAEAACMEQYGYHPETVIELKPGKDD